MKRGLVTWEYVFLTKLRSDQAMTVHGNVLASSRIGLSVKLSKYGSFISTDHRSSIPNPNRQHINNGRNCTI